MTPPLGEAAPRKTNLLTSRPESAASKPPQPNNNEEEEAEEEEEEALSSDQREVWETESPRSPESPFIYGDVNEDANNNSCHLKQRPRHQSNTRKTRARRKEALAHHKPQRRAKAAARRHGSPSPDDTSAREKPPAKVQAEEEEKEEEEEEEERERLPGGAAPVGRGGQGASPGVRGGAAGAGAGAPAAAAPAEGPAGGEEQGGRRSRRAAGGGGAGGRAWGAVKEEVQGGALPRVEQATLAALGQLQLLVEAQEARLQAAGGRQASGGVAAPGLLGGRPPRAPLAADGSERAAKVLVELGSDLVVAQELPAGGTRLLLLLGAGGLLGRVLGGPRAPGGGRSSVRRGQIRLLARR